MNIVLRRAESSGEADQAKQKGAHGTGGAMCRLLCAAVLWMGQFCASAQELNIPRFYVPEGESPYAQLQAIVPFQFSSNDYTCLRMNNRGDIVGSIGQGGTFFARLNGVYISLNALFKRDVDNPISPCFGLRSVDAINENGDIVGTCQGKFNFWWGPSTRIFMVRNGIMTDLDVPDEPEFRQQRESSYFAIGQLAALRLNKLGEVLVGDPWLGGSWIYSPSSGKWTRLAPGTSWVARDFNDRGEVVGQFADTKKGGIWFGGSLREIPNNPGTAPDKLNSPVHIANDGHIAWTSGHITDEDGNILETPNVLDRGNYNSGVIEPGFKITTQNILRCSPYLWRNGDRAGFGGNGNPDVFYFSIGENQSSSLYFNDIDDLGRLLHTSLGVMRASVPLILDQPRPLRVRAGQPAVFSVTVAGATYGPTTPIFIMNGAWKHEAGLAEGSVTIEGSNLVVLTNNLRIAAVSARHAGNYYFVATNVSGVATSAVARLEILTPPEVKQGPTDIAACPGSAVQFAVEATGVPAPAFQWQFNGKDLPGETGPTLTLREVGPAAEGLYSVTASNSEGSVPGGSARLSLLAAPAVQSVSPAQTVPTDAKAVLAVAATGSAPLAFHWRRNGEPLPEVIGPVLSIEKAGKADTGEYSVTVVNGCGAAESATMVLTVLPPPPMLLNPRLLMGFEVAGEVGRTYRIEAKPDAGPQDWTVLARLTLATSPQFFLDMDSPANPKRIYRAVAEP